ncbi:MAG: biopolymer transporter ExbD [Phycisphaeraceae bacterium]|nr:biopolymer transporter ExbD [Phycisphaeraceae bacterium]MCW5753587.1 biopolymer transporter ExbD [Phycisphaeraceae bacterium]
MNWTRPRRRPVLMDMTPMIDVVLQLIIFFMFTTHFAQAVRSPIDLPQERGDDPASIVPDTVTVDLDASGRIIVGAEEVTLEELERLLRVEIASAGDASRVSVLVRADASAPSLHLNRLANRLSGMGLRGWRLGTIRPMGGGG